MTTQNNLAQSVHSLKEFSPSFVSQLPTRPANCGSRHRFHQSLNPVSLPAAMNDANEILNWLENSPLAIPLRGAKKGFFILRGKKVQFEDGFLMDVLDWLQMMDIWHGKTWGDYQVSYTEPGGPYAEKLTFFYEQNVYPVPFARPSPPTPPQANDGDFNDTIPF